MSSISANKVALISGGSRGIGAACVKRLAHDGYDVYFTYLSSREQAESLVESLDNAPGEATAVQADARSHTRAREIAERIRDEKGRLDLTVCNAVSVKAQEFLHSTEDAWKYSLDGVLHSAYHYARVSVDLMTERQRGCILFISSINGTKGREGSSAYGAGKAAMINLSRTMARELGSYGVRVNSIAPGFVDTEAQTNTSPLIKKLVRDETPLPGYTQPEDIAASVAFLASDEAKRISGHTLVIDGGQWA